jgi:glutamine cyclotransferase
MIGICRTKQVNNKNSQGRKNMGNSIQSWVHGDTVLAKYIPSTEWKDGLQFHSDEQDFVQVGTWKYNAGKQLLAHKHNQFARVTNRTHEVIYVKKGRMLAYIFDLDGKLITDIELQTGDTLILLECGHGYRILEEDTQILEVKNGMYYGAEQDRVRL